MDNNDPSRIVIHCPSCGHAISSAALFCPSCGAAIEQSDSSTAAKELAAKLSDIDNRKIGLIQKLKQNKEDRITETATLKAQTIRSFPVPSKRNDLIDIINMAASSINAKILMGKTKDSGLDETTLKSEKILSEAWHDKLESTYQKAKALLAGDPDFSVIDKIYTAKQQEIDALREKPKKKKDLKAIKIVFGILIVIAFVLTLTIISNHSKEEKAAKDNALTELVAEIRQDLSDGNYDEALLKTNRVRLKDGSSVEEEAKWDRERESLIDAIEAARGGN